MADHAHPNCCLLQAVFTSQLWQSNIKSIEERREAALQAWENSNRAMVVDKLRQLVSAKEHILHTMSHELRTPLLGILGEAGVTQQGCGGEACECSKGWHVLQSGPGLGRLPHFLWAPAQTSLSQASLPNHASQLLTCCPCDTSLHHSDVQLAAEGGQEERGQCRAGGPGAGAGLGSGGRYTGTGTCARVHDHFHLP